MTDWRRTLLAVAPRGKPAVLDGMASSLPACIERADLLNKQRLAHFIAQTAHESDGFHTTVEYASGAGYEGRKDLGNVVPGDGKRYRGRGVIQLTGRANYRFYGQKLGVPLEDDPGQAATFPVAALTAAEFWRRNDCNTLADADDIIRVTRKINGGTNGLESRKVYLARAKHALSDVQGALVSRATEERKAFRTAAAAGGGAIIAGAPAGAAAHKSAPGWGLALTAVFVAAIVIGLAITAWRHANLAGALDAAAKGV